MPVSVATTIAMISFFFFYHLFFILLFFFRIFSVKSFACQINVHGLKQIKQRSYTGTNQGVVYTLFVDGASRHCTLTINSSGTICGSGNSNYEDTQWIPSSYRPKQNKYTRLMRSNTFLFYAWSNGTIGISNFGSTATEQSFSGQVDWNY